MEDALKGWTTYEDAPLSPISGFHLELDGQELLNDGDVSRDGVVWNHGGEAAAADERHRKQQLIRQMAADRRRRIRMEGADLDVILGVEMLAGLDPFDRVQLSYVTEVCQRSNTLSDAEREIFAVSWGRLKFESPRRS